MLIKTRECQRSRTGRRSSSTETNGQSFLRRPGPTKGCRASDDDDDDDDVMIMMMMMTFEPDHEEWGGGQTH